MEPRAGHRYDGSNATRHFGLTPAFSALPAAWENVPSAGVSKGLASTPLWELLKTT